LQTLSRALHEEIDRRAPAHGPVPSGTCARGARRPPRV